MAERIWIMIHAGVKMVGRLVYLATSQHICVTVCENLSDVVVAEFKQYKKSSFA